MELLEKGIATFREMKVEIVDSIDELLQKVDVVMILSIDGRGVSQFGNIEEIIMLFEGESGTERTLEIKRGDETIHLTVVLDTYI